MTFYIRVHIDYSYVFKFLLILISFTVFTYLFAIINKKVRLELPSCDHR